MARKVSIGRQDFQRIRENNNFYVDKTHFIREWWEADDSYNDFIKALLADDVMAMNFYMNKLALQTFSYFDSGKKPSEEEPERFYHGFVLGLMVELADKYVLTSNREKRKASCACLGRYDIMMEPCQTSGSTLSDSEKDAVMNNYGKDAIIIEFKVLDSESGETSLADTVQDALKQIDCM